MSTKEEDAVAAQEKRNAEALARRDPHAARVDVAGRDRAAQDEVNRYPGDYRNLPPGAELPPPRTIVATDLDAQEYVTVWDHGPRSSKKRDKRTANPASHGAGGLPAGDATPKETESDTEWYDKNGKGPVPLRMHATDARHAMNVEPDRYALEPKGVNADAKLKEIQQSRADSEKRSAETAAATQLEIDHREAAAGVLADRKSEEDVKNRDEGAKVNPGTPTPVVKP